MTETILDHAIKFAVDAHRGQMDKGGAPYILHPLRVMLVCKTDDERIAAVLHDVIEDHPRHKAYIKAWFPRQFEALMCLTRAEGEDYMDFIARCNRNPVARAVKLADLADNMDLSRIPNPSKADLARVEKYRKALEVLK